MSMKQPEEIRQFREMVAKQKYPDLFRRAAMDPVVKAALMLYIQGEDLETVLANCVVFLSQSNQEIVEKMTNEMTRRTSIYLVPELPNSDG